MSEVKSKPSIIRRLEAERRRLEQNLSRLKPEEMSIPGVVGEWTIKDVLAHLADWEEHMLGWVAKARQQNPFPEVEEGMKWEQFDVFGKLVYALNERIYARHKEQSLEEVLTYFRETHRRLMEMVMAMSDEELLTPGRYTFLGGGAIYDWLGAYAAHDRWAKTHIRKWMKRRME